MLGCTRQAVEYVCKGEHSPGMRIAASIEKIVGIPMRDWLDLKTETVKIKRIA